MNKTRHLAISIVLSLLILVTGTAGYMIIEDWRFLDAFYMTIITIKKPDGTMLFNPSFEAAFRPDDTVIAVGEEENLQKLEKGPGT